METAQLLLVAAGIVLAAVSGWGWVHSLRRQMRARCTRLEEALRTYTNASVVIGRQLTGLESELRELRQRLAAVEGSGTRPGKRETPCVTAADVGVDEDAEQRLSRLLRSRLGEPRAVV
ncbi:MAG: hypothetical protein H7A12_06130 [Pseudomonadales bacterium]|jgi:hypothetical protein|nr:hypothetical protein [Pseudomonadales bacterium]MCP5320391.1 hypothetical protein [Pseudomonadales bacterium]